MCAKRRIQVITMGCSKNLVDSERLMYQLSASGFEVLHEDTPEKVSAVVINTCGFIGDAKEESIDMILRCIEAKKAGKIDQVIVMGCLSERYKKDLLKEIPEVDEYFGVTDLQSLVRRLGAEYCSEHLARRIQTTPSHYAYLKIAEGCDRSCAFCAIPGIRGKYKSVFPSDILNEAGMLVENGVKELLLIAQDLTYYGKDLENRAMLPELVESLSQINGIHWIRLHYGYPAGFPTDLLRVMRENEKVCKYLDLPFQHISSKVLKAMHRNIDQDKTLELIQQIREEVPGIVLRTTLLTGFPGETEKDFQFLEDFVHKVRFERLGVFAYSHEENTYAGDHYLDNVPAIEKQRRVDRIMEIQQDISLEHNESMIGSVIETLIDREEGEFWYGRTPFDSPEVDNEVLISKKIAPNLSIGQFYSVKITGASDFELEGQPV